MPRKIYVIDTSVCLTDFNCIFSFENNDVILPLKVLEEIDRHKKRQDSVGTNARNIIRSLDVLREKGSLYKGVKLKGNRSTIFVKLCDESDMPSNFDISVPDNEIIGVALNQKKLYPRRNVVVVSNDINMRVKCDALGLETQDYTTNQIVKHTDHIHTGFKEHLVDDQLIDRFYEGESIILDSKDIVLQPNQFIMLVSNLNRKKTALARFYDYNSSIKKVNGESQNGIWGVKPRNKEQMFALELLLDPSVSIITLIGKAGGGKTLLAIAAGLNQVMETHRYKRLVISRPIQPLGRDIGYLPGTLEEKMLPWVAPIQDNLKYLMGNDRETLQMYINTGVIEVEALTYIRGRSIANAYIIIDEAQNLTAHELKTILTRVGEGTKIILTGDIEQIDNVYLDETSNGLTHAVEKFKSYDISGHMTLMKGERSRVATLAAKIL